MIRKEVMRRAVIGQRIYEKANMKRITRTGPIPPISGQTIKHRVNDISNFPRFDSDIYRSTNSRNVMDSNRNGSADNLRLLHHRAKEARNRKARALRELEENHPLFDRPLFFLNRYGRIREFCRRVVTSQYGNNKSSTSGSGTLCQTYRILLNNHFVKIVCGISQTSCCLIRNLNNPQFYMTVTVRLYVW